MHPHKIISILFCLALTILPLPASTYVPAPARKTKARAENSPATAASKNDSIVAAYTQKLRALMTQKADTMASSPTSPSPYLFRLFGPATLYSSALTQSMSLPANAEFSTDSITQPLPQVESDPQLAINEFINEQLCRAYVQHPELFATTQAEVMSTPRLRSDLSQKVEEQRSIAQQVSEAVPEVIIEAVEPEVKRPNFWTFKGNGSIQFSQSYFSKNWYKGGVNSYTMLTMLAVDFNYNNQRKVQLDNRFDFQLGFQAAENNVPKFRPTNNLVRLTSNLNIKAIGNWNYSAQLQLQSQPCRAFQGNTSTVASDFLSPLYVRTSIGMDFNIKLKRFTGKLHLAPLSYEITYVKVDSRVTRYGISEGHNSKHDWGPNVEFTFDYKITKDISWHSRNYWFSNLKLTRIEMENTFNFAINKYLSAKFFLNPRYEDTKYYNVKYNEDGTLTDDSARETHWMLTENLSFGLSYDF